MLKPLRAGVVAACCILVAQTSFALMVGANIKSLHLGPDYPEHAQEQIRTALRSENCKFLTGRWINGHFQFEFAGSAEALNGMLQKLSECPGTSVAVLFRGAKPSHDWQVDLDTRSMQFRVTVNTNSGNVALDQLTIPPSKGPPLKP